MIRVTTLGQGISGLDSRQMHIVWIESQICQIRSDAAKGVNKRQSGIIFVRNSYLIQNATFEIGESTSGPFFQRARNVSNEFAHGGALTRTLGHLKSVGAPDPDGIWLKTCYLYRSITRRFIEAVT